jgi:hypothetical protein
MMQAARALDEDELYTRLRLARDSLSHAGTFAETHRLAHLVTLLQLELARRVLTRLRG